MIPSFLGVITKGGEHLSRLSILYWEFPSLDKTTCIVETNKLRDKETKKQFSDCEPEKLSSVSLRHNGKVLDAMVIASSGKFHWGYVMKSMLSNPFVSV